MKYRIALLALAVCLLCSGCTGWMDGSYSSVTPHPISSGGLQTDALVAGNSGELKQVLQELVSSCTEKAVIHVVDFTPDGLESALKNAVRELTTRFPLGAYAVERISYDIGVSGSVQSAVSVEIDYKHDLAQLRRIKTAQDMNDARELIEKALTDFSDSAVMQVEQYLTMDLQQVALDYSMLHPELVMEVPQISFTTYPEQGNKRILEIKFTYQNSKEAMRQMLSQVQPVFASAQLYINAEDADYQKYAQLYAFLMERFDYRVETSVTPSYSLLRHGVGDSRAFACVYAAMCRASGLDCRVVLGTKAGEAWYWNLIADNGSFYHVDLLRSSTFQELSDAEMTDYVWDYSAYPAA